MISNRAFMPPTIRKSPMRKLFKRAAWAKQKTHHSFKILKRHSAIHCSCQFRDHPVRDMSVTNMPVQNLHINPKAVLDSPVVFFRQCSRIIDHIIGQSQMLKKMAFLNIALATPFFPCRISRLHIRKIAEKHSNFFCVGRVFRNGVQIGAMHEITLLYGIIAIVPLPERNHQRHIPSVCVKLQLLKARVKNLLPFDVRSHLFPLIRCMKNIRMF